MMTKEQIREREERFERERREFYEARERHEKEMDEEVFRVMAIMEEHGYSIAESVNFDLCHQYVKVETQKCGRIYDWFWAVPKRENFKAVLKWFCGKTKFYGVTAYMAYDGEENVLKGCYRRIPTFYSVADVERNYDEYFGDEPMKPVARTHEVYREEEDDRDYCPSATAGDYSPSCPWRAPGMSPQDFI